VNALGSREHANGRDPAKDLVSGRLRELVRGMCSNWAVSIRTASRPDKPTDNAFIEAFNGRFRATCLNQHWFLTLADAAGKLEAWRRYCNEVRPHGAIGNKAPIMLTKSGVVTSPSP